MDMLGVSEEKRQVPKMLQNILRYDVQVTKKFVEMALKTSPLRSLRNHAKLLEVSCHGIVWLAGWLSFIWLFNNKELYQIQVNMLIALILDIIVIAVIKAFVRRRRPVPMNKLTEIGPDKYSFPSGHASRATLIAFILMYQDPISFIFYPPLLAWVTSVALSRILLERHYILDVLGGFGIGILEGLVMCIVWFSQSTSSSILASLSDEKRDGGEFHV
ncbi:polyisoprenoid diphosphate/phosphate phosphohydrolase PLPP6 isoform X1 [Ostrinia nubilalis]|uniref:phospholipid phosphatase 6 isoform X1 n=2 Tax=Ostrinia furnacalis TaxID=93504 RepID=UPI00103F8A2F|nr:phospholipid phosphatase 6 isoform X1 [Ostrinia furnacalis]XP_028174797.1 phospholipid phosphatase 6 isoform X1 [Ostrinia furnacalis]